MDLDHILLFLGWLIRKGGSTRLEDIKREFGTVTPQDLDSLERNKYIYCVGHKETNPAYIITQEGRRFQEGD